VALIIWSHPQEKFALRWRQQASQLWRIVVVNARR
jgi:hypothetical protein